MGLTNWLTKIHILIFVGYFLFLKIITNYLELWCYRVMKLWRYEVMALRCKAYKFKVVED